MYQTLHFFDLPCDASKITRLQRRILFVFLQAKCNGELHGGLPQQTPRTNTNRAHTQQGTMDMPDKQPLYTTETHMLCDRGSGGGNAIVLA
eukprot:m.463015 g.463015  ORF g.463015 m.463015 type:complete len:91 (-) comp21608_c0_seq1:1126-1398(-)